MLSFSISGSYTDLYELTIGEVNFLEKRHEVPVAFDYFFRKIPAKGGYVVFAGLSDLLDILETLHFTKEDIAVSPFTQLQSRLYRIPLCIPFSGKDLFRARRRDRFSALSDRQGGRNLAGSTTGGNSFTEYFEFRIAGSHKSIPYAVCGRQPHPQ